MDGLRKSARVGVVGGGIAGLTAAWLLKKRGIDVVVFEKERDPGGNIRSGRAGGHILERGPYCFLKSSRSVWRLLKEAGLESEIVGATALARKRYIFKDGRLNSMPLDPLSFAASRFFSWEAKLRLLAEPFIRGGARENETAWEFFQRRFGEEFATFVASSFVSGVYAGDIKKLGARAAFPRFWNFEKEHGSMILGAFRHALKMREHDKRAGINTSRSLWTFRKGLGFITHWLAGRLKERVVTSFNVRSLRRSEEGIVVKDGEKTFTCKSIILAVPPYAAGEILKEDFPEASSIFDEISMAPVAVVQWEPGPRDADVFPEGFGFLVPPFYKTRTLGTIFYSHIFPHFDEEGKGRIYGTFVGGAHDPRAVKLDDEAMIRSVLMDHRLFLGRDVGEPSFVNIVRHPRAIAQLGPDHPEKMKRAALLLGGDSGIFIAGGYVSGVGMDQAVESAYRAVSEITGERYDPTWNG